MPSLAVTRSRIRSPLSPLPAVARFSDGPVAPAMSVPFRVHWYAYVSGFASASCAVTVAVSVSFVPGDVWSITTESTTGGVFGAGAPLKTA